MTSMRLKILTNNLFKFTGALLQKGVKLFLIELTEQRRYYE